MGWELDGKDPNVDDFQPRKQAKVQQANGNLKSDESIKHFSKTYLVDEVLLRNYLDHLKFLDINKRKRAEKRQLQMQQDNNRQFADYDWLQLLNNGLLKKLKVSDLDKYLNHYGMKNSLKLKKPEKVQLIQGHITSTNVVNQIGPDSDSGQDFTDDAGDDDDDDGSDDDIVIADTRVSDDDESDEEDIDIDDKNQTADIDMDCSESVEAIFTTTRSGRFTTNWRASRFR